MVRERVKRSEKRRLTVVLVSEGSENLSRTYTFSHRRIQTVVILVALLGVGFVGMTASWVPLARKAAASDEIERQVTAGLELEDLARKLAELEERHQVIRNVLIRSDPLESDFWLARTRGSATERGGRLPRAEATEEPTAWPLTVPGFITRPLLEQADGEHPGIDIAVPAGSYVRAAGSGEVVDAAEDPVYGLFVLIDHGNGVRSLYGHASVLAVDRGRMVRQGEVIALSGSTGRSTAPHLHFEILRYGRPVDPLSIVTPPLRGRKHSDS